MGKVEVVAGGGDADCLMNLDPLGPARKWRANVATMRVQSIVDLHKLPECS